MRKPIKLAHKYCLLAIISLRIPWVKSGVLYRFLAFLPRFTKVGHESWNSQIYIFPDDDGALISLPGSGVVINGQHSWLLLQTREKFVQKRLDFLELFWSCFACGDGEKHACPPCSLLTYGSPGQIRIEITCGKKGVLRYGSPLLHQPVFHLPGGHETSTLY